MDQPEDLQTFTQNAFERQRTMRSGKSIKHSGYLSKEGKTFKFKKNIFCVLMDCSLSFYKDKGTSDSVNDARRIINMKDVRKGPRKLELIVANKTGQTFSLFASCEADFEKWYQCMRDGSQRSINKYYTIIKPLGKGAFGEVFLGSHNVTGDKVAIKSMARADFTDNELNQLRREIIVSTSVDHDNLVKTFDVFETATHLFLVMDYAEGGPLYKVLAMQAKFTEAQAADVMKQILKGVEYLHNRGVVHRDLKSENVLCSNDKFPLHCMLADFGLSRALHEDDEGGTLNRSLVGTPAFVAPEVLKKEKYGPAVDMWSCGVILWNLLTGKYPFKGKGKQETLDLVIAGRYNMNGSEWINISEDAKSFIKALLQYEPKKRLTARAALRHPFFDNARDDSLVQHTFGELNTFLTPQEKFKRSVRAAAMLIKLQELMEMDMGYESDEDVKVNNSRQIQSTANIPSPSGKQKAHRMMSLTGASITGASMAGKLQKKITHKEI